MSRKRNTLFSPIAVHGNNVFWAAGCLLYSMDSTNGKLHINGLKRPDAIRSISISDDGQRMLIGDDSKAVALYNLSDISLIKEWCNQAKKVTCASLVDSRIIFGDRYGDVREINADLETDIREEEGESSGKLALGHLCSSITCLATNKRQNVLVTADGDEKIRVSSLTNPHVTKSFCLGHTEFISSVQVLPGGRLASSSADGFVKLWNFKSGVELSALKVGLEGPLVALNCDASSSPVVCVCVADRVKKIAVLTVNEDHVAEKCLVDVSRFGADVLNALVLNGEIFVSLVDGRLLKVTKWSDEGESASVELVQFAEEQKGLGEKEIEPVEICFWRWRGDTGEEGEETGEETKHKAKRRRLQPPVAEQE